jgi:RNA polymerase sigma-70 factor (ECF subfamily)
VAGDSELVRRLRGGDEEAFAQLACRYHGSLVRLAAAFVPGRALAEEVARDTWLGMLDDLDLFDGRAPVKTWLFRILINRARSAGEQTGHSAPAGDPAAGPGRFDATGGWAYPPQPWPEDAGERLCAQPARQLIRSALDDLPAGPRRVVLLRDVEGLAGGEVCGLLGIDGAVQRLLLHHGRARVRRALAQEAGSW